MTKALYQTDSYLRTFEAQVIAADAPQHAVLLDRTAFYPGGGGQPFDLGELIWEGGHAALERVRKQPDGIWHVLVPAAALPEPGTALQGRLDWERRYRLMRTHMAMHMLCGVVFRDYGALVTGGDMEPLLGRMDFEFESLTKDLVHEIEAAVNREVQQSRPLKISVLPRQEAFQIPDLIRTKINLLPPGIEFVRTVEIVGLDLQADGGTHVANTREVGRMAIPEYKSKGKINKRIYVQLEQPQGNAG